MPLGLRQLSRIYLNKGTCRLPVPCILCLGYSHKSSPSRTVKPEACVVLPGMLCHLPAASFSAAICILLLSCACSRSCCVAVPVFSRSYTTTLSVASSVHIQEYCNGSAREGPHATWYVGWSKPRSEDGDGCPLMPESEKNPMAGGHIPVS